MLVADSPSASLEVDVQVALTSDSDIELDEPPSAEQISAWAITAFQVACKKPVEAEVTIRLVDNDDIQSLNRDYRQQDKPTNVLAFPFDMPTDPELLKDSGMSLLLLGDVIICHSVIVMEARQQSKNLHDHYAHIVTHGVLHLCGYDHIHEQDATIMETLEANILAKQSIDNPYH